MKKDDFVKLGIDEETAKTLETASLEELKGYIPKARFDEVNNEKKTLERSLQERNEQLEVLKTTTGDLDTLKAQIASLQAENKAKEEAHAKELRALKLDTAIDTALMQHKAKNKTAVKALLNGLEDAELLEDGTVSGLEDKIKAVVKSDPYLFETKTSNQLKGAKPGEGSDPDSNKGADISKMTYSQLSAYLAANPDVKIN